jgi:hypothetical protein
MKPLSIDGIHYQIPEGLHEISLESYFKATRAKTTLDYCLSLTNIPEDIIQATGHLIPYLVTKHFQGQLPEEPQLLEAFYFQGQKRQYKNDVRLISFGQFTDILELKKGKDQTSQEAVSLTLAILFQRADASYGLSEIDTTAKKILSSPAGQALWTYKQYCEQESALLEEYGSLFEAPTLLTPEQVKAHQRSKEFGQHWGWYASIVALAKYWNRDKDFALRMNVVEALNDLSYMKDESELHNQQ